RVPRHQLSRPLELLRRLVELLPLQEDHAEVVVRGTVEEVGGQRLAQQPLRRVEVARDQVRRIARKPLRLRGVAHDLGRGRVGADRRGGAGEEGEGEEEGEVPHRITRGSSTGQPSFRSASSRSSRLRYFRSSNPSLRITL